MLAFDVQKPCGEPTEVNGVKTRKAGLEGRESGGVALSLMTGLISVAVVVTLIVGVRSYSGGCGVGAPSTAGAAVVGADAPELVLKDISGKAVKLSDHKGKVVVLNFWATWCGPCRAEIPAFVRLREQYEDRGLEIIGVSLDEDATDVVSEFATEHNINYPILIGTPEAAKAYGPIDQIPTTFIVGRQGRVLGRHLGMMSFERIESAITPLL